MSINYLFIATLWFYGVTSFFAHKFSVTAKKAVELYPPILVYDIKYPTQIIRFKLMLELLLVLKVLWMRMLKYFISLHMLNYF